MTLTRPVDHSAIIRFKLGGAKAEESASAGANAQVMDDDSSATGKGEKGTSEADIAGRAKELARIVDAGAPIEDEAAALADQAPQEAQREALARLRGIDVEKQARIEGMDMIGEWGTKVSTDLGVCCILYNGAPTRNVDAC